MTTCLSYCEERAFLQSSSKLFPFTSFPLFCDDDPTRLHHPPWRNRMVTQWPPYRNLRHTTDIQWRETNPRNRESPYWRRPAHRPLQSRPHVRSPTLLLPCYQTILLRHPLNPKTAPLTPSILQIRIPPPPRPKNPRTPRCRLQR